MFSSQAEALKNSSEMSKKIKEGVKKQLDANFLKVVNYSPWIANIVVHRLPMKEGYALIKQKVLRMCPEMSKKIKAEVMK